MIEAFTTRSRLRRLAVFLEDHRPLWEQRPFVSIPVSWERDWPKLSRACRSVTASELLQAEDDPIAFFSSRGVASALMNELTQLCIWPHLGPAEPPAQPLRPMGIDGRKWSQLVELFAALEPAIPAAVTHWVDWCAGKGHLGEMLVNWTHLPVVALEWNAALVQRASARSNERPLLRFQQADVLTSLSAEYFDSGAGIAALHACGELNARLLTLAALHRPAFLAVVPCCYQRIDGMHFTPLSEAARNTGLTFTRHQLRLPALDEVSVSDARRMFRKREMAFRLGTDLLLRQAMNRDEYTPLGSIPPHVIRGPFADFAQFAAKKVNAFLPDEVDWRAARRAGEERGHLVSALGLVRQLFRRALESWLFLDRIAFLEEADFSVTAGTFCHRRITPRNLLLWATPK